MCVCGYSCVRVLESQCTVSHPSTDSQRCPSQRPRPPRRPHWRSSPQVHAPTLPAAGTVPTPPTRIPPSSPRLPPPPIHAFPHPRRRPTAPILPDGATRPAPALPDAQPHRAAPPDAQPHRAAPPHTVPRANPKWIRMPGAIRAPPLPLPRKGPPSSNRAAPREAWGLPQSASSDAGRSSRASSEVTRLPQPRPLLARTPHLTPTPSPGLCSCSAGCILSAAV